MALTPRQELAYNHLFNFYEPSIAITSGKPGPATYTKHAAIRGRLWILQSPSAPSAMGRVESDIVVAIDKLSVAEDQEIDDSWWIENITLLPDGSQSEIYGRFWIARGEPQKFIDSLRRRGGHKVIACSQESRPPEGLPF